MSVVVALAAGLLIASPFARGLPAWSPWAPTMPEASPTNTPLPPLRNRLERRIAAARRRRGLA